MAIVTLDSHSGDIVFGPEIITHGFVYTEGADDLIAGTKEAVVDTLKTGGRGTVLSTKLKDVLSQYLYQQTRRRPMVIPVITEV